MTSRSSAATSVTRRHALARGAAGMAAVAGGMGWAASADAAGRDPVREENPWRYDIEKLRRVDPALVRYDEVHRFEVPQGPARRLAFDALGELHVAAGRRWLIGSRSGSWRRDIDVKEVVRIVRPGTDRRFYLGFRNHVEVWDAESGRVARWAAFPGKAFITGLAVTDREVFVADAGNRVVHRCDLQGRIELRLGERQEDRGVPGLVLPSPFLDVEVGADGLLRINNPGRHRVEVYTRDGDLEDSWGRAGVAPESFCGCCNPVALALLPDGRCITAEKGLPRVKIHRADGTLESYIAVPDAFEVNTSDARARGREDTAHDGLDVAVDKSGEVAVLDLIAARVHIYRRRAA